MAYIPTGNVCIDIYEFPNQLGAVPKGEMTYADADATCRSMGKRVPTQREHQLACEGPGRLKYAYGNSHSDEICEESFYTKKIAPSGSKPQCVNEYGLYDLSGNLFEHVQGGRKKIVFRPSAAKYRKCVPGIPTALGGAGTAL